jgi:hypothetical protein
MASQWIKFQGMYSNGLFYLLSIKPCVIDIVVLWDFAG